MTVNETTVSKIIYTVNERTIALDRDVVEKYSETVCPINEHLLITMIKAFENDCNDTILSAKIQTDMADEIKEY